MIRTSRERSLVPGRFFASGLAAAALLTLLLDARFELTPERDFARRLTRASLPVVDVREHVVSERRDLGFRRELESFLGKADASSKWEPESRYAFARKKWPSANFGLLSIDCFSAPICPSRSPTCS